MQLQSLEIVASEPIFCSSRSTPPPSSRLGLGRGVSEYEAPSKRIWGGTSDAPTWFFRRNPPFAFAQNPTVRVPETPPEPPFRSATQSGGVLVCATSPPKSFPAQRWRRLDRRA